MNPGQALETAAYNFLTNVSTPISIAATSIYKGLENSVDVSTEESNTQPQTRVLPCVTLMAEGLHGEAVFRTRIFQGMLAIRVEASAHNTTDATFNTLCEEVFAKFNIQELATNMSAETDDFTCVFARVMDNGHAISSGDNWENTIRIECIYGQADL